MMRLLFAGQITLCLLFVSTPVFSQEVPLYVMKDKEHQYTEESRKNIVKLAQLIRKEGSVDVWATLDPGSVGFSPKNVGLGNEAEAAQDLRTKLELGRIMSPLIAQQKAAFVGKESESRFGTSGLIRIYDQAALHKILSERSVVLVTRAGL